MTIAETFGRRNRRPPPLEGPRIPTFLEDAGETKIQDVESALRAFIADNGDSMRENSNEVSVDLDEPPEHAVSTANQMLSGFENYRISLENQRAEVIKAAARAVYEIEQLMEETKQATDTLAAGFVNFAHGIRNTTIAIAQARIAVRQNQKPLVPALPAQTDGGETEVTS